MFGILDAEPFRPGDTIVLPFLILAGNTIVNLSGGAVAAELTLGDRVLATLTAGLGLAIEDLDPAPAQIGEPQAPHGVVELSPALTALLPIGPYSKLSLVFVNSAGVRMHAAPIILRGVE